MMMRSRRGALPAAAIATMVALTVAGCGGGGGGDGSSKAPGKKAGSSSPVRSTGDDSGDDAPSPSATTVLAQLKGEKDVTVTINSATRDHDGFVTVEGQITNNGSEPFSATNWTGNETAVQSSGDSVAGATLVDEAGKKRYYVLRDTDGKCLCTMGLILIRSGETRPFFAQFPSPPAAVTDVEFQLPTMPPAKITISEG